MSFEERLLVMGCLHNAFVRSGNVVDGIFIQVIKDLAEALSDRDDWAIGGGIATGFHSKPRTTEDVDIMIASDESVEDLKWALRLKFKATRGHAVVHKDTGVEVEFVTPDFVAPSEEMRPEFRKVFERVLESNIERRSLGNITVPVIGRNGLIALKMLGARLRDKADIEEIIRAGGDVDDEVLRQFGLSDARFDIMNEIRKELEKNVRKFTR